MRAHGSDLYLPKTGHLVIRSEGDCSYFGTADLVAILYELL